MQKHYLLVVLLVSTLLPLAAQNGLIGQGFAAGFSNPADIAYFNNSFGGSRINITTSTGTGDQYFRLVRAWDGDNTEFAPAATCPAGDQNVSALDGTVIDGVVSFGNCDKAFFINVPNTTDNYVFKTPAATGSTEFIYFRLQGPVASVILTQQMPSNNASGQVPSGTDIEVASLTDLELPTGQAAYLRYTTDGFATSTVIPMNTLCVTGSCILNATIPGQPDGTPVSYYVFTSGDAVAPAADGSDADYRTINADNNFGNNFTYTTSLALPVTYTSFTGRRQKADVVDLAWATATEDGASHFSVECSADGGRTWMERATVAAKNRPDGAVYGYTDQGAPLVDLSYRLRQTDIDGSYQYSSIALVAALETGFRVWPQPAVNGQVNFSVPDHFLGGQAELRSMTGRKVSGTPLSASEQEMEVNKLPAGIYLLRLVTAQGETATRRVVVR